MSGMSVVGRNIVANFLARTWTSVLSLIFVPVYLNLLGVEAYGLIGIFASLAAILALLDMGLSATLSRELSRLAPDRESNAEARDITRTFEVAYWIIGLLAGGVVVLLAPYITSHWINAERVDPAMVQQVLVIMGVTIALQWPGAIYAGGLMGLQRQVSLNTVRALMAVLQHGGAVLLLLYFRSIAPFFIWQAVVGLVTTLVLGRLLWRALPATHGTARTASFRRSVLVSQWRFTTGVTGISLEALVLTQVDKLVLSKMLTLELFGYYMLAFNVANALQNLVAPLVAALHPRFTQLTVIADEKQLVNAYHRGCQLLAVIVLPAALTVSLFAPEILHLWLRDPIAADASQGILSLLILGTALNALITLPYVVQLALGRTRLVFIANAIAIIVVVPAMVWMMQRSQGIGAAWGWITINAYYFFLLIPAMHREVLRGEMGEWYWHDVLRPLLATVLAAALARVLTPAGATGWIALAGIGASLAFGFTAAVASASRLSGEALVIARKTLLPKAPGT